MIFYILKTEPHVNATSIPCSVFLLSVFIIVSFDSKSLWTSKLKEIVVFLSASIKYYPKYNTFLLSFLSCLHHCIVPQSDLLRSNVFMDLLLF